MTLTELLEKRQKAVDAYTELCKGMLNKQPTSSINGVLLIAMVEAFQDGFDAGVKAMESKEVVP